MDQNHQDPSTGLLTESLLKIFNNSCHLPQTRKRRCKRSRGFMAGYKVWHSHVFRYDYQLDNMLVVNQTGYETCIPNEKYIEYDTGKDMIQLAYGGNYLSGTATPGDCCGGMKLTINALAPNNKD
ncbi:hypothetical protein N665_0885s0012 [Sinapis alba]|nr:hypothetical protein N665_0885s0012 [Sinapis alba]